MKTIDDLKQEFVDHLAAMDKSEMSMFELSNYADLLYKADALFKPSYTDVLASGFIPPLRQLLGKGGEEKWLNIVIPLLFLLLLGKTSR